MKFMSSLAIAAVSIALAFSSINAEAAKRMGGGKSTGQQSQNVTNKQTTPANAAPAQAAKPAAAPAPAAPKPWGAMLGGLAAGLGLAWLANSMGLGGAMGGAMGNILMMVMFAGLGFLAWNMYKRYKANQQGGSQGMQPAYAQGYNPQNVGNDSAARPFERTTFQEQNTNYQAPLAGSQSGSMIGSGIAGAAAGTAAASSLGGSQTWGIPTDFDTAGFLTASKSHFVALQAAWDKSDMDKLRAMMTEEMVTEIRSQIAERDATSPAGTVHRTEVITIEAHLLGIEEVSATRHYMASVEFSGQIREEVGLAPEPFREVWNLTKPVSGGGWLVAGIQAV
jgi:predicted lipid-binding transport protein (Tim44 family)